MKNVNNSKLKIIPLGGLEQIGMNITAFDAPSMDSSLITLEIAFSFPGMALELKITVSPGLICTFRCILAAMRDRAAMDSPWLPVVINTSCSSG